MPRGVKPQSTVQRKLNGNPGKRAYNHQEPQPPELTRYDLPPELEGNNLAIKEWVRLVPMLRTVRQITEADRAALIALCREWSIYLNGCYSNDRKINLRARQALNHCLRLWPELGLTPSSRTRVKAAEPSALTGGDTFSEFDAAETSGETH